MDTNVLLELFFERAQQKHKVCLKTILQIKLHKFISQEITAQIINQFKVLVFIKSIQKHLLKNKKQKYINQHSMLLIGNLWFDPIKFLMEERSEAI